MLSGEGGTPQAPHEESVTLSQPQLKHAFVAFGSNLSFGDDPPERLILRAIVALAPIAQGTVKASRLYRTPCFPVGAGPDFVNAAAVVTLRQGVTAPDMLALLHSIEASFGRRRQQRWGMRTLDIDLLALDDSVLPDAVTQDRWRLLSPDRQAQDVPDQLILPHPRMQDRAFVLVPLSEVAADWHHPRLGQSVAQMLARLPAADVAAVTSLE